MVTRLLIPLNFIFHGLDGGVWDVIEFGHDGFAGTRQGD
jgi:hypothetical protein